MGQHVLGAQIQPAPNRVVQSSVVTQVGTSAQATDPVQVVTPSTEVRHLQVDPVGPHPSSVPHRELGLQAAVSRQVPVLGSHRPEQH